MMRAIAGVGAGLVTWIVVATLLNLAMRALWPGYVAVESAMSFDFPMQIARLVNGALSSLAAGFVAASITRGSGKPVLALAALLLRCARAPRTTAAMRRWNTPSHWRWRRCFCFASCRFTTISGTSFRPGTTQSFSPR